MYTALLNTLNEHLSDMNFEASGLDQNSQALKKALKTLGALELLALKAPRSLGGMAFSSKDLFFVNEELARHSGALMFIQKQHQSAVELISNGKNTFIKDRIPSYRNGQLLLGVAIHHLRNPQPTLDATEKTDSFYLNGTVSWVSGYEIFDSLVVGFALSEKKEGFALISFKETDTLKISPVMDTLSMPSINTVSLQFTNYPVHLQQLIDVKPKGYFFHKKGTVPKQYDALSGCAYGVFDFCEDVQLDSDYPKLIKKFHTQHENLRKAALKRIDKKVSPKLHAKFITLTKNLALDVFYLCGPKSLLLDHPINRILREIIQFSQIGISSKTLKKII